MVKLTALVTLLALLGTVSGQGDNAVSPTYPSGHGVPAYAHGPSPSPIITYPPGVSPSHSIHLAPSPVVSVPSPIAYPPSLDMVVSSPASPPSSSGPADLLSPSPSSRLTPPTYPPHTSSHAYSPSESPSNPNPSLSIYSPDASPSQPTYLPSPGQHSPSPSQLAYPPSPSPWSLNPSPINPSSSTYSPGPSPVQNPGASSSSPTPLPYGPTASPSTSPAPADYLPSSNPPINSPSPSPGPDSGLSVGHYSYSCPNAEAIVREAVKNATDSNRGTGAGLIRLFFHDCFVRGCDASVLLNTTASDEATERLGSPNRTLRGFEVIDAAKSALEESCPGVVSCSDILAFAGRDATYFLTNRTADFAMPAGRYDGLVSLANETVPNLPAPFYGLQQLNDSFAAKGLSLEDMVTLSGAHSVGRSSCSSFSDRLSSNTSDMDPGYATHLRKLCGGGSGMAAQDFRTPDDLDREYYRDVVSHDVLFGSDAVLMASNETARMVMDNASVRGLWESKFVLAMVKMGGVGVKTSTDGEIRRKCWIIN